MVVTFWVLPWIDLAEEGLIVERVVLLIRTRVGICGGCLVDLKIEWLIGFGAGEFGFGVWWRWSGRGVRGWTRLGFW
jgi:hypothetical protein